MESASRCWSLKRVAALAAAALAVPAVSAIHEPPAGKHYIGAWLDYPSAGTDLPVNFNARLGFNASFFHLAMDFPDATEASFPRAALGYVDNTLSDAFVYLSVYPKPSPTTVTDDQIDRFARLLAGVTSRGRRLFVRFGPEMNGNWQVYGQKPDLFKDLWRRTTVAIRKYSKDIAMVWSPNFGDGYPYPGGQYAPTAGSSDYRALDTNNDGTLSGTDDPYSPYYPGDDLVDYVSLSVYWFGPSYPYVNNTLPAAGLFERFLTTPVNFYQLYSVAKNKPMFITESAAAFHERILPGFNAPSGNSTGVTNVCAPFTPGAIPVGPGEVAIKRAFWGQYITNATFLTQFSRIVGFGLFEFRECASLTSQACSSHMICRQGGGVHIP
ncbi:glycoside hydrolase superfamily [Cladochytrium replicatum]|nr:glycoside hydrolase superfamily [Cladochytrium replicatum]